MRTMNNNIGRLDNAVGIMAEQHTELISALRMGFQQPFNPPPPAGPPHAATAGQPSPAPAPPPSGSQSAVVRYSPTMPVVPHPPGSTLSRPAASQHQPPSSSSPRKSSSRAQASSDDEMDVDKGDEADNEGDIPEPLPVLVKKSQLKLKGMPRARDPVRKALLVCFRLWW